MRKMFCATALLALTLIIIGSADAQWIEEGLETYDASKAAISVDGDFSDWDGIEKLTGVEFKTANDEWVVFEEYNGGVWDGPDDQTVSVAFAWEADALYLGIKVVDDEHQNNDSWYDGDAAQIVFADADQANVTYLYNYALNNAQDNILIGNEQAEGDGLTPDDVAIVRNDDEKVTVYEAKYAPEILGVSAFEADMKIGIGVCVNDGDIDTPGQKGWGGWGPHAAVFGKNGDKTGLVTLSSMTPTAVDAVNKLSTTWGEIKE